MMAKPKKQIQFQLRFDTDFWEQLKEKHEAFNNEFCTNISLNAYITMMIKRILQEDDAS